MKDSLLRTDKEITQIYDRHINTVYRVCFMYMKNKSDTEDMVQNVFVRLMGDKTPFETEEHEKAWLIRTATNLCIDHFRGSWTRTSYIDEIKGLAESLIYEDEGQSENYDTLAKVLALPRKYKAAIYMYYYEDYSTAEIAKILGRNPSTIRSHLHTGRKLLKIEMEKEIK